MKYSIFILKAAFNDFKANKIRTLLTTLGILIGISSVVLLLAFGQGLKKYIEDQFKSIGSDLIMILPGKSFQGGFRTGGGMMEGAKFDEKDVFSLKKIKSINLVVPSYGKYSKLQGDGNTKTYELVASTPEVFDILNMEAEFGRIFGKNEVDKRNKVVVLGSKPAEKIYGSAQNALGKIVKIESLSFKVIGVLKSKGGGGFGGPGMDDHIFIPYTAALSFNPTKSFIAIYAKAVDEHTIDMAKQDINNVLLKRYNKDDFSVVDSKEVLDTLSAIFNVINIVLVGIAAISLVVGGIGIMNIMYVSVVEKIKEIGVRRAIGATKKDVLFQFLSEAIILSLFGGFLGLLLSFVVVVLIQKFFPAYINLSSVLISLGVSFFIGIIFGVVPAKRAADLSPIEAIKAE